MTVSQSCKSVRRARCLSTSHGRARSDILLSPQIARQFTTLDATGRSFVSRFIVEQLAVSARSKSASSSAAVKYP